MKICVNHNAKPHILAKGTRKKREFGIRNHKSYRVRRFRKSSSQVMRHEGLLAGRLSPHSSNTLTLVPGKVTPFWAKMRACGGRSSSSRSTSPGGGAGGGGGGMGAAAEEDMVSVCVVCCCSNLMLPLQSHQRRIFRWFFIFVIWACILYNCSFLCCLSRYVC